MKRNKRRFERVPISAEANVRVTSSAGRDLGTVVVLGPGGMLVRTEKKFQRGKIFKLVLTDPIHNLATPVVAKARYTIAEGVGFEYEMLTAEAAVAIGVIIGSQLAQRKSAAAR